MHLFFHCSSTLYVHFTLVKQQVLPHAPTSYLAVVYGARSKRANWLSARRVVLRAIINSFTIFEIYGLALYMYTETLTMELSNLNDAKNSA